MALVSVCLISDTSAVVVFATADSCLETAYLPGLASQPQAKIVSLPANRDDRHTSLLNTLFFIVIMSICIAYTSIYRRCSVMPLLD